MPQSFLGRIEMILSRYGMSIIRGAGFTMLIALIGTVFGCLIGLLVGMVQTIPHPQAGHSIKKGLLIAVKFICMALLRFLGFI